MDEVERLIEQDGFFFPSYDAGRTPSLLHHLRTSAQGATVAASLCKHRRVCVQAGGHVGIWPLALAWMFDRVLTFEPQPSAFAALCLNTVDEPRIQASNKALWHSEGPIGLLPGNDSGTWKTAEFSPVEASALTIDSLDLAACDAIYLDVETSEPEVLAGAEKTVRQFWPVLHLEVLPQHRSDIESRTKSLGYRLHQEVGHDCVYVRDR